jgi:Uma2 family endonuclease
METLLEPEIRKFSVDEYYRLAEAGILSPSERVELLNGLIIRMPPIGTRHRTVVDRLNEILTDQRKNRYRVSIDQPIRIEPFNEPQPDVVLYDRAVKNKHPSPEDIYRVIEVAETTLGYDSGEKLRAYEQGGVNEYWIIDLAKKAVQICHLEAGHYQVVTRNRGGISPRAFPDVIVDFDDLFRF